MTKKVVNCILCEHHMFNPTYLSLEKEAEPSIIQTCQMHQKVYPEDCKYFNCISKRYPKFKEVIE